MFGLILLLASLTLPLILNNDLILIHNRLIFATRIAALQI